ncbi:cobalamin synthase CobS [Gottschalkia purinilytica]|uniref:Adenosylcobinamide-GDP ribazoletransferase n=1 Tax=Gottschalkia purinilytica TaxID=1503 RepID=A0A0L0W8W6_GOTPU|nr:adenosylcobinamide-GDP ribazoletransferase [Gottschalkia purinilytica]KNF07902.1 cobalamin synthase CobS [Gottschalkia purinilytica]
MRSLLLMIVFLTRIPIKYPYEYKEEDFVKGIKLLPIVGMIIGLVMYIPTMLDKYIDKPIIILLVWLTYIWITGGLHLDGLTDTFDGIFSNRDRERMLEIMKDSRIGTFGVIGLLFVLFCNIVVSYYLGYKVFILVPIIGRSAALISCSISRYARNEDGMGTIFIENCGLKESIFGLIFTLIVSYIVFDVKVLTILLITYLLVVLTTKYIKTKIGGMTGDTIGFVIEVSQSIFIIAFYLYSKIV